MNIADIKKINEYIDRLYPQIVEIRRHIHENPELSGQELKTAKLVFNRLKKLGLNSQYHLEKTAVITPIINGSGSSVVLRADMDALPINEKTELPYCSKIKGVMHACGHDMHTAILLGAAELLTQMKELWQGTVYCLFQPSEEVEPGGAFRLIEKGVVPAADSIFGLHVNTDHVTGTVGVKEELDFAGITAFDIVVHGKGGHGATPEVTIDPIVCASTLVIQLQTLVSREVSPFVPVTLTIGEFKAGSQRNVIPDQANLHGTIRCHSKELLENLMKRITEMVSATAQSFRTHAEVIFLKTFPPTNNNPQIARDFKTVFESIAGDDRLEIRHNPSMYAEDFAFYQQILKGIFIHLGVRPLDGSFNGSGLHSSSFTPDEQAIKTGILSHVSYVLSQLVK
ncbi:MAG TPA: M20 family metallopeptidase [Chitinispirillaceae bacterium]|nr:M20 family metallopeptidase [Chitinispirillaceae bacterium]